MKKSMLVLFAALFLIAALTACGEGENQDVETVDLACCATGIAVRPTALLGANSATYVSDDFIMTLNSDKLNYRRRDTIRIWGTLEYVGENETIKISHGCPFMVFSLTGNGFDLYGFQFHISTSSVLERGMVYRFDYQKTVSWDPRAPDAEFWENFANEPDLRLPRGEYTVTLTGSFSHSRKSSDDMIAELTITVR